MGASESLSLLLPVAVQPLPREELVPRVVAASEVALNASRMAERVHPGERECGEKGAVALV
eukprot:13894432-Heterocapsa_arctica.AAC.1